MGLFGPSKGSIGEAIKGKTAHIEKARGRSASQIQAQRARERNKEIKEEKERKKREARDVKRAKLLAFNPPNARNDTAFRNKAIKKGEERRAKAAARKAQKKAARKAGGFWG